MNEESFWDLISLLDWEKTGKDEAVIRPVVKKLMAMDVDEIHGFDDILAEKLFKLDAKSYAEQIGSESFSESDPGFSVDSFLYARCCVVANGRAFYESVLADPRKMPKDMEFESLIYIAGEAYEKKTGDEYEYTTKFNYETFSNEEGWTSPPEKSRWKFWK